MNKETLEEAAEKYNDDFQIKGGSKAPHIKNVHLMYHFTKGAEWAQERVYSEAIEFAEWIRIKEFQTASKDNWIGLDMKYYTTEELFEQFKERIIQMSIKEKAKELYYKYTDALNIRDLQTTANPFAKQCTLIAVDEILLNCYEVMKPFWEEVKQEIEKL